MTSRLDARILAGAIAQRMGAPAEPRVYQVTAVEGAERAEFSIPIERGPFVAFDGWGVTEAVSDEAIPLELAMANRPITWPHRRSYTGQVGVGLAVLFPTLRVVNNANEINLDGWPAPMFCGAGDTVRVRFLRPSFGDIGLAIAGFHTSRDAWLAIHAAMGELRAWVVGTDLEAPETVGVDEVDALEPVEVWYAYSADGNNTPVVPRTLSIENKTLVDTRTLPFASIDPVGIGSRSNPGTVIGPRPLNLNGAIVQQWQPPVFVTGGFVRYSFVGVTHDDL